MSDAISWSALAEAVEHYAALGWTPFEVPWLVPLDAIAITRPTLDGAMAVPGHGFLVGSAEQSFLHLQGAGRMGRGRFLAVSPCFRAEPVLDRLHLKTFMKVELYRNDQVDEAALQATIADAEAFFSSRLPTPSLLARERTEEGWDLTVGGIEVGSYGIRRHGTLEWVYGTGVAEPRLTAAIAMASGR